MGVIDPLEGLRKHLLSHLVNYTKRMHISFASSVGEDFGLCV